MDWFFHNQKHSIFSHFSPLLFPLLPYGFEIGKIEQLISSIVDSSNTRHIANHLYLRRSLSDISFYHCSQFDMLGNYLTLPGPFDQLFTLYFTIPQFSWKCEFFFMYFWKFVASISHLLRVKNFLQKYWCVLFHAIYDHCKTIWSNSRT